MVFVEILRAVVSEIKINKITIIPVIVETSGYSLITIRNTVLQVCTYILSKNLRSLRILQYTSNMMSFESTTIVQFPFKELPLFSFRIGRLRHHFFVSDFREIQCSIWLTITVGLVSSRRFITFNPIGVIRIISESTYKAQSFSYKIQFLFQRKTCLNIILPTFIISGLCSHYPRIHIIILVCPSRNFSIRIFCRHHDRIISHQYSPQIICTTTCIILLTQRTGYPDLQQSRFRNINIHIHTVRPFSEMCVCIIILKAFVSLIHTLLILITSGNKVTRCFTTTTHIQRST